MLAPERYPALLLAALVASAALHGSEPGPSGPTIRVGLGDPRPELTVRCSAPFRILDPDRPDDPVRSVAAAETVTFLPAGDTIQPRPLFRVMLASSRDEAWVRELGRWLEARLPGEEVSVQWNPERDAWRLYAGAFPSREEAATLAPRLVAMGFHSPWITERTWEEAPAPGGRVRVEGSDGLHPRLELVAVGTDPVFLLDGRQYRGRLEVIPGPGGALQAVNVLPTEEYLRGVVPREMGPLQFPRIEALKAQAVAARTYALRGMGLFGHLGYDLCDGPRCQAYGGAGIEHPMTDRAVRETRGEVLLWEDRPIRSFYTASCGGHTEEVSEIFVEETEPYLRAVPCREANGGGARRVHQPLEVYPGEDGRPLNPELVRLAHYGTTDPRLLDRGYGWGRPTPDELSEWKDLYSGHSPAVSAILAAMGGGKGRHYSRVEVLSELARTLDGERPDSPPDWYSHGFAYLSPPSFSDRGTIPEGPAGKAAWLEDRTREELNARLHSRTGTPMVTALQPLRYGRSGRVTELLVRTESGDIVLKGIRVRWGLGLREIPTGWSAPSTAGQAWTFQGGGWGHGVGLCQRGAFEMARRGKSHREILLHYYSEPARLETVW